MNILVRWLITTFAIIVSAYILPGITVVGLSTALLAALVLGLINVFLKPILIILTLPINIITLGLFTFVINAALVLLTARLVPGFEVAGFWWALLFSLIVSIVTAGLHSIVRDKRA